MAREWFLRKARRSGTRSEPRQLLIEDLEGRSLLSASMPLTNASTPLTVTRQTAVSGTR